MHVNEGTKRLEKPTRTLCEAVEFTEESSENPIFGEIVDQMHPRAWKCHHEVRNGQVNYIKISGRPHPFVSPHSEHDCYVSTHGYQ